MNIDKFNLSLDDMSPHPKAGIKFESIEWCEKLIADYPQLKINLFVPAAYCRLGEQSHKLSEHMDWVKKLRQLSDTNYRINMHGLYHRRISPKHGNSNNDEWQFLEFKSASILAAGMFGEFTAAGLIGTKISDYMDPKFRPTFRPPGWKISKGSVYALQNYGVNCFAGSKEYYKKVKDAMRPGTKWVSYNWDLTGPCNVKGDVVAYGHTSSWTNNYMDETRYKLVKNLLDSRTFDFRFIEEM